MSVEMGVYADGRVGGKGVQRGEEQAAVVDEVADRALGVGGLGREEDREGV
jgi:hypothetical protein